MTFYLLDGTLQMDIFFECDNYDLEDNICISIIEDCPTDERLLIAEETHIYLTQEEARQLGQALLAAAERSQTHQVQGDK